MALKVEIYEKDTVRPFSPTPESLRNYKLSLLDQQFGSHYTPTLLFYNSGSHHHDYDQLKESLSKTLSVLYPLAGRVKDEFTIECNDKGADFVIANVTNYDLTDLVQLPKLDVLEQLLPCDPYPNDFDNSQPMLAVQMNKFRCGGTAVAICLWHGVADGAAIAGFLKTWAAINLGQGDNNVGASVVDAAEIFPPKNIDFSSSTSSFAAGQKMRQRKYSTKRFVFSKQEIERIRDEEDHRRPTRVVALSAFLWAAMIRATRQDKQNLKIHFVLHSVDLRKKMNPPFPSMCLGNIIQLCPTTWDANGTGEHVTAQSLAGRIRESIVKVSEAKYVREILGEGGYQKVLIAELGKSLLYGANAIQGFTISSLCGFPFLECDFGWGKPIWCVPVVTIPSDAAYFFDTTDGGIEIWIGLPYQLMSNFDKDIDFLSHVSCSQIISEPL